MREGQVFVQKKSQKHIFFIIRLKPFVICRKNFLFSKSVNGAEASGRLFSILQTAKANGLVPEMYLSYCLENVNKVSVEDLLPWSEKLPDSLKVSIK